uniref:SCP domain-containing protein n=1 Tax=Ditylenchus dipsaci TaxID=166011 RepID=A0A915DPA0_9BILA
MQTLYKIYNQTLEDSAQLWANNCTAKHSGPGENMYYLSGNVSAETALLAASDFWWGELAQFGMNRDLIFTQAEIPVGHWSEMAWGRTTQLGCGVTFCPNGAPPFPWPTATLLFCHYREYGNYLNNKVYEAGSPCTKDKDCTTFPNSYCNANMGLCLTVPLSSLPTALPTTTTIPTTTVAPEFTTLTAAERSMALDYHNSYRSQLAKGQAVNKSKETMPQGKNIYQLSYDESLEASAQALANKCKLTGSQPGVHMLSYPIKASFEFVIEGATQYWWSELAQLGINQQLNYTQVEAMKTVSHWSQMAWGKTTSLGCAMAWCTDRAPPVGNATILVCQYKAVGSIINQLVYEAGSPCAIDADCTTYANSNLFLVRTLDQQASFSKADFYNYIFTYLGNQEVAGPNYAQIQPLFLDCYTRGSNVSNLPSKFWYTRYVDAQTDGNFAGGQIVEIGYKLELNWTQHIYLFEYVHPSHRPFTGLDPDYTHHGNENRISWILNH